MAFTTTSADISPQLVVIKNGQTTVNFQGSGVGLFRVGVPAGFPGTTITINESYDGGATWLPMQFPDGTTAQITGLTTAGASVSIGLAAMPTTFWMQFVSGTAMSQDTTLTLLSRRVE